MKVLGVVIAMVAIVMSIDPGVDNEPATSNTLVVSEGNGTILSGYPDREEQIKLMIECIEDAVIVCKSANIYPLTYWSKDEVKGDDTVILAAEIAVAFFNYRIGDK